VELLLIEETLEVGALLDLACVFDYRQVTDVEGKDPYEVPAKDFCGE
jgi:hypothetical protein